MSDNPKGLCKGICVKYKAIKPKGGPGRYASGQVRCQVCDIFMTRDGCHDKDRNPADENTSGLWCNCCNYRVTSRPHSKKYIEKLKTYKEIKSFVEQNRESRVGESVQVEEEKLPTEESQKIEFKSTFKFDLNRFEKGDGKKVQNKEVEKEVSIAVSSMANADGGQVFIGIGDNGEVLGLEKDYELFDNPNDDEFQRIVWQSIKKYLNDMTFISKIHLSLLKDNGKKICKIVVPRSDEPIFVYDNSTHESYVRIGSRSEKLLPAEFMKYCKKRLPRGD